MKLQEALDILTKLVEDNPISHADYANALHVIRDELVKLLMANERWKTNAAGQGGIESNLKDQIRVLREQNELLERTYRAVMRALVNAIRGD